MQTGDGVAVERGWVLHAHRHGVVEGVHCAPWGRHSYCKCMKVR
jgi:hypothetical protein